VITNLKDDDYVGVTGFDDSAFPVVPLRQLAESRAQALDRVRFLVAAGVTNLLPAMRLASQSLEGARAGRKHMIILTDGVLPDSAQSRSFYHSLAREMRTLGITISTVMIGTEGDPLLRELADLGGGAHYQVTSPEQLPRLFLEDVRVSTGEQTARESEFAVRVAPGGVKSTTLQEFPNVLGYVETKVKPNAELELVARTSEAAQPLLVSWNYGKGRALAFTSDASGVWSKDWIPWSKFHQFWSEVLESIRPKQGGPDRNIKFDLRYALEGSALKLDVTVFNEDFGGVLGGELTLPGGEKRSLDLSSISRGRFVAEIPGASAGKYEVQLKVGNRNLTPVAFNLSGDLFGEKKGQGFNVPLLTWLASVTEGEVNPAPERLKGQKYSTTSDRDLTPWVLLLGLLVFLLEILWREIFTVRFNKQGSQA
jgi:hypothetical protein